jgi:hypothetical protein
MTIRHASIHTANDLRSTTRIVALPLIKNVLVQACSAIMLLIAVALCANNANAQEDSSDAQMPVLAEVTNQPAVADSD